MISYFLSKLKVFILLNNIIKAPMIKHNSTIIIFATFILLSSSSLNAQEKPIDHIFEDIISRVEDPEIGSIRRKTESLNDWASISAGPCTLSTGADHCVICLGLTINQSIKPDTLAKKLEAIAAAYIRISNETTDMPFEIEQLQQSLQ